MAGTRGATGAVGARGSRGAAALPSARPSRSAASPPYEEKDIPYWHDRKFGHKLEDIAAEADEVVKLQAQKKALEEEISAKQAVIRAVMEDVNKKESWSVRDDDWTLSYIKPKDRRTLVPELLIQQGVSKKIIEKATKETPVTPFVQIVTRKPKG